MYRLILPIIFSASVVLAAVPELPANFKICSRSDPDMNGCLKAAVHVALRELIKGSRSLGVLPIDPLQVNSLGIYQGSGPVAIELDFNDLTIEGMSKIVVESSDSKLDGDVKKLSFSVKAESPIILHGNYTIKGKVLILPIAGTGKSKVEMLNTRAVITFTGKVVKRNDVEYLSLSTVKLDLRPTKVKYFLGNLFNGDKALGDNMNMFLNENDAEIYKELQSPIEKAFGATFIAIAKRIFDKIPYDQVFPK